MPQPSLTDDFKHELEVCCSSFENEDDGDDIDGDGGADTDVNGDGRGGPLSLDWWRERD